MADAPRKVVDQEDIRDLLVESEMRFRRVRGAIRKTQVGPHYDRIVVEDMLNWLEDEIGKQLLLPAVVLGVEIAKRSDG